MKKSKLAFFTSLVLAVTVFTPVPSSSAATIFSHYLKPWTQTWLDQCSRRHKSFNPRTGYYRHYTGRRTFCKIKVNGFYLGSSNPWPPYPRRGKTTRQWQDCVLGASGNDNGYTTSECND